MIYLKRLNYAFLLLFTILFMVGCKRNNTQPDSPGGNSGNTGIVEKTCKLIADDNFKIETLDIDKDKIKLDSKLLLSINIPEGKEIKALTINEKDYDLINVIKGKFSYTFSKDTTMSVSFKDITEHQKKDFNVTSKSDSTYYIDYLDLHDEADIVKEFSIFSFKIINIPFEKEIDYVLVNDTKINEINSLYSFVVLRDSQISIRFKNKPTFSLTGIDGTNLKVAESTPAISDLSKVIKGTSVTLLVVIPSGKVISLFNLNDVDIKSKLVENKFIFEVTENSNFVISFS